MKVYFFGGITRVCLFVTKTVEYTQKIFLQNIYWTMCVWLKTGYKYLFNVLPVDVNSICT